MRSQALCPVLFVALLTPALSAQKNWVSNGDFSQGLTGWTGSGAGDQPKVESFDVTGLGANPGFGVNAGPRLSSSKKPPYILAQDLIVGQATYELYVDLAMEAPGFNNDAGTVKVRFGGVEIARKPWGRVTQSIRRDVLCVQFRPKQGGKQKLEILFDRTFASLRNRTPRLWIDNVGLWLTGGPSFGFHGDRKPGQAVTFALSGSPNSAFVVFVAAKAIPGFPIPGIGGTWRLDLASTLPFLNSTIGATGKYELKITLPGHLASLQGVPLFFQPLGITSSGPSLGIHHNYGLQK